MQPKPTRSTKSSNSLKDAYSEWEKTTDDVVAAKHRNNLLRALLIFCALVSLAIGRWYYKATHGLPIITLMNQSGYDLTNVVVSGKNWSRPVPVFKLYQIVTFTAEVKGESPVNISFGTAIGGQYKKQILSKITENDGYCPKITVDPGMTIEVTDNIHCFRSERVF